MHFLAYCQRKPECGQSQGKSSAGRTDVDPLKIKERYYKSLDNIKVLMELCDILHVYDNTNSKPVRIIRKHKEEVTVFPNEDWDEKALIHILYRGRAQRRKSVWHLSL